MLFRSVNRVEDSNFDGEIDDDNIKKYYETIDDYWNEDFSNGGGVVGAVAGALGSGAELGKKIAEGKQKKKYFGRDMATKQAETRQSIISGILAKKQADSVEKQKQLEADQKSKRQRNIIIGSLVGVALILGTIYLIKTRKNG